MTRLPRSDLERAVSAGILSAEQADRLAEFFGASPATEQARFTFVHVLYYLGGMIAIGAMSLFMTLGWNALGGWGGFFTAVCYGVLTFWGGLSSMKSGSELGKLVYCGINVAMILIGAVLGRRVFAVFGGLGIAGYLGHLSYRVFKDSLVFPFALSLTGLAIIWLGVIWQRHEGEWSARLRGYLPAALRELVEARG